MIYHLIRTQYIQDIVIIIYSAEFHLKKKVFKNSVTRSHVKKYHKFGLNILTFTRAPGPNATT